jgi:hypothetical protein
MKSKFKMVRSHLVIVVLSGLLLASTVAALASQEEASPNDQNAPQDVVAAPEQPKVGVVEEEAAIEHEEDAVLEQVEDAPPLEVEQPDEVLEEVTSEELKDPEEDPVQKEQEEEEKLQEEVQEDEDARANEDEEAEVEEIEEDQPVIPPTDDVPSDVEEMLDDPEPQQMDPATGARTYNGYKLLRTMPKNQEHLNILKFIAKGKIFLLLKIMTKLL